MAHSMIMLLGRRDEPTDAVEDYCRYLGEALHRRGREAQIERVAWTERGWPAALSELRKKAEGWRGNWVVAQYTALAWSKRGFPLRFIRVMKILSGAGVRLAVVFHDVEPYGGARVVDDLRRRAQVHTMQRARHYADPVVFTVALNAISWLGQSSNKAVFIPVGANLPLPPPGDPSARKPAGRERVFRVAVFGITGGAAGKRECEQIGEVMRAAAKKVGRLRLHAFGRAASDFASKLRSELGEAPVELQVEGVLPAEKVVTALKSADVMLFVRAPISSRRGSAIAGIACGLPVIAYTGPDTAAPITEAGVVLVEKGNSAKMTEALVLALTDDSHREWLEDKSRAAYQEHFSWDAIAARFAEALDARSSTA